MEQTQATQQANPVVLPITSLEQFVHLVASWYEVNHQKIEALANYPEHEDIKVQDNITGEERVLTGKEREAFVDGLKVAATFFGSLPFQAVPVDEQGQPVQEVPAVEPEAQVSQASE